MMVNPVSLNGPICCTYVTTLVFLITGEAMPIALVGSFNMTYRILAVIGGAFALAACSTNLDAFKSGPSLDTVSLESEPPGAEAKASNGQTCRTPCSLALPVDAASSITFTLSGYQPETEKLEAINSTGEPPRLTPNPVVVELTAAAPGSAKKPAAKKKPAPKKPVAAAVPAPPAMTAAPAQASSPWPTSSPARQN